MVRRRKPPSHAQRGKANQRSNQRSKDKYLNILSWNINHNMMKNMGPKTDIPEFRSTLTTAKIFCLQETKGEVKIADSGGLCIGIHRSIADNVRKQHQTGSLDIQALTLHGRLFNMKKDILLINVYNSPENSSYKRRNNYSEDVLDTLLDFINDNYDQTTSN